MWTFAGVRVFVQDISEGVKQIIAELNPIRAGSIYQQFGWESDKYKVEGLVVGNADKDHLKSLTTSGGGASFELVSPEGNLGSYYVRGVDHKRLNVIYQTIRPDLDCESPVYKVSLDLIKVI